jgi:hypothetical protein
MGSLRAWASPASIVSAVTPRHNGVGAKEMARQIVGERGEAELCQDGRRPGSSIA